MATASWRRRAVSLRSAPNQARVAKFASCPSKLLWRFPKMRLALFQPDIPQNLGAAIRLAACLDVNLEVIEPCGFPLGDRALRRAALDYGPRARIWRHDGWSAFRADPARGRGRLVLMTTKGEMSHLDYAFMGDDTLLLGRES